MLFEPLAPKLDIHPRNAPWPCMQIHTKLKIDLFLFLVVILKLQVTRSKRFLKRWKGALRTAVNGLVKPFNLCAQV